MAYEYEDKELKNCKRERNILKEENEILREMVDALEKREEKIVCGAAFWGGFLVTLTLLNFVMGLIIF